MINWQTLTVSFCECRNLPAQICTTYCKIPLTCKNFHFMIHSRSEIILTCKNALTSRILHWRVSRVILFPFPPQPMIKWHSFLERKGLKYHTLGLLHQTRPAAAFHHMPGLYIFRLTEKTQLKTWHLKGMKGQLWGPPLLSYLTADKL